MIANQNTNFIVYRNADTLFETKHIVRRIPRKEIERNGYTYEQLGAFALELGCPFFAMHKGAAVFKGEFKNYDTIEKSLQRSQILESRGVIAYLLKREIIDQHTNRIQQAEEPELFAKLVEQSVENITSDILDDAELVTQHVLHDHFELSGNSATANEFVDKSVVRFVDSENDENAPIVGQVLKVKAITCSMKVLVPTKTSESRCVFNTNKELIAAKWSEKDGLIIDTIEDDEEYEEEDDEANQDEPTQTLNALQLENTSLREENASLRSKFDSAVGDLSSQNKSLVEELAAMKRMNEELLAFKTECQKKTAENLALKTKLEKQKEKLNSCRRFINEMTKD